MKPIASPRTAISALGALALYAAAWLVAAGLVSCGQSPPQQTTTAAAPVETPVQRGTYLVSVLACNDCHTPFMMGPQGPVPDMSRMLSGHPQDVQLPPAPALGEGWGYVANLTNTAHAGPWGITFSANLTPDTTTGMGTWTEQMFVDTFRTKKHWGTGRGVLPPMPIDSYSNLTDADLKAVYAFLRTIPPVKNEVPPYAPPGH